MLLHLHLMKTALHYNSNEPFRRYAPERLDRRVKSICLLNVVIKQGILINTHKTKQAMSCRVTCNRDLFITRYCVFIQVMTQH